MPPAPKLSERVVEPAPQPMEAPLHVTLDAETHFGFNQYRLQPSGETKLDQLLADLTDRQFAGIVITGYTDRLGSKAYNEKLSERRALSAKAYLTKRGVDARKIQAHGAGEGDPVTSPGACEGMDRAKMIQCLAPDRRVELEVMGARQR
jgi:OOP family OmpA-OmpF porin